ncbi:hypothetical protein NC653_005562 [Populus alba x Populus x berolinensis]|uniref:Uncharacterized protein n=1 Tax=Populus alba x Populus x berolinensis TaxID=444605 RepID=A0AAD6RCI2_9ROSI|nr:hypothetical protein NC653_005562 [Populus alba x Populus x berolinensis]
MENEHLMEEKNYAGERSAATPATSKIQNDIIGLALTDAQKLLGEYVIWLKSNSAHGGKLYKESFEK